MCPPLFTRHGPKLTSSHKLFNSTIQLSVVAGIASGLLVLFTIGCKQFTIKDEAGRRIDAFKNDRWDFVDLGMPITLGTTNTAYVLAHPDESRLLLVKALKDRRHPMKVGLAAYCLRKMKDHAGHQEASKAIEWFNLHKETLSANEYFAQNELRRYIESSGDGTP